MALLSIRLRMEVSSCHSSIVDQDPTNVNMDWVTEVEEQAAETADELPILSRMPVTRSYPV
jgi:hypothetical protein